MLSDNMLICHCLCVCVCADVSDTQVLHPGSCTATQLAIVTVTMVICPGTEGEWAE